MKFLKKKKKKKIKEKEKKKKLRSFGAMNMLHLPITLTFIGAFDVKDHLCLKNGWTQFV